MLTVNLEPIYAIVLAVLIFGEKEQMTPAFYIGAFVIFLLVLINGLIKNRHQIKSKIVKKHKESRLSLFYMK